MFLKKALLFGAVVFLLAADYFKLPPIEVLIDAGEVSTTDAVISETGRLQDNSFEFLKNELFVEPTYRSVPEVQADVSIFGSAFEDASSLIEGMPFRSMQTGHHSFQLPVWEEVLGSVSLVDGVQSSRYGASFGAAAVGYGLSFRRAFSLSVGSYNTLRISMIADSSAALYERSDGYRENTAYQTFKTLVKQKSFLLGGLYKSFGAQDFYAPFPSQEEILRVFLMKKNLLPDFSLKAEVLQDNFVLKKDDPSFYKNMHTTYNLFARWQRRIFQLNNISAQTSIFADYSHLLSQGIGFSTGMGTQDNLRVGAQSTISFYPAMNSAVALLQTITYINNYGVFYEPGLEFQWKTPKIWLRTSSHFNVREPSFTERFYQDPMHYAESQLKPERSFQLNQYVRSGRYKAILTFRRSIDAIDWVYNSAKGKYYSRNLNYSYFGFFNYLKLINWRKIRLNLAYAYQHYFDKIEDTKYLFKSPEHKISLKFDSEKFVDLHLDMYTSSDLDYKKVLINGSVGREIKDWNLSIIARNLLNVRYNYASGLPAPGLQLSIKLSKTL